MNKLSKSSIVLIALAVAAVAVGIVLFLNMPELDTAAFGPGRWLEDGAAHQQMFEKAAGNRGMMDRGARSACGNRGGFPFGIVLVVGFIIFMVSRKRVNWRRTDHSRTILDQMFAEEKISEEEYRRKRTVMEEE